MEVNKWQKWEKIRAKGTLHFILIRGLIIAFSSGLAICILEFFVYKNDFETKIYNLSFFILFAIFFGSILGLIEWFFSETAYQRSSKNKDFNIWMPKQKDNLENSD